MKSKKSKLLISLLSIGGLSAVLVPTLTLTSCSSTLNPRLENFKSSSSQLTYIQTGEISANSVTIDFEINNDTNVSTWKEGAKEFSSNSFAEQWKKLKTNNPKLGLPDSITSLDKEITSTESADVLELIKNQNYLNIFTDTIINLRNVYENFISALFIKNWNAANIVDSNSQSAPQNKDFLTYLLKGFSNGKFYAGLFLSDIKVEISISGMPNSIGTEGVETSDSFKAEIKNIQLNYKWFQRNLNSNNLTEITDLKDFQSKGYTGDSLSFVLNTKIVNTKIVFNMLQNKINNKYYKTGLIRSDLEKPFIFEFITNEDDQNQNKSNWFNNEVLSLTKEKVVTPDHLNNLFAKIGYLTKNNLPENNTFPSDAKSDDNIKLGKTWVNNFIGITNLFV